MFLISYFAGIFAVLCFVFGLSLFYVKRNDPLAFFLALVVISAGTWSLSHSQADVAYTNGAVIFWSGIAVISIMFLTAFFLSFVEHFTNQTARLSWKKLALYYTPAVLISLFAFSRWSTVDVYIPFSQPTQIIIGPLYIAIVLFFYGAFAFSYYKLFRYGKSQNKKVQYQVFYISIGTFFTLAGAAIFDVILPILGEVRFYSAGPLSTVFMIGFISYAILRHQLMDIRIIIQRGLIYSALLALIVVFYLVLVHIGLLFQPAVGTTAVVSAAITTILGIFTVPYIEQYFRRVTDKFFFKDKYDYSETLHELSDILNKYADLETMLIRTSDALKTHLRVEKVFFLLTDDYTYFDGIRLSTLSINYPKGYFEKRVKHPDPIIYKDIPFLLKDQSISGEWHDILAFAQEEIQEEGTELELSLSIPIIAKNTIVGFVALGPKLSGDRFSSLDLQLIQTFVSQAAIALQRAKLYQQVADHAQELEKKVEERTKEIATLQKGQQQMMLDISHGLQTPLTVIKSELDTLKKNSKENEKVDLLARSIDETSRFIYDLLTLARLESRKETLQRKRLNVSTLLEEIVEYFTIPAQEKEIAVRSDIAPKIMVESDPKKLEEVFANLMGNAMKYMKTRGKREISVTAATKNKHAVISISDTGVGIEKKDLSHIFDRFYRSRNGTREKEGTGLGLAIAKETVEALGGTITVTSKVGVGTTFTISLPLAG